MEHAGSKSRDGRIDVLESLGGCAPIRPTNQSFEYSTELCVVELKGFLTRWKV